MSEFQQRLFILRLILMLGGTLLVVISTGFLISIGVEALVAAYGRVAGGSSSSCLEGAMMLPGLLRDRKTWKWN